MRHFGVEIEDLERIFGHFSRVLVILSGGCRGPTPLLVRTHQLFDPVIVAVHFQRDRDRLFLDV